MNASATGGRTSPTPRRWVRTLPWVLLLGVAGAVVWASASGPGGGVALDPSSTGSSGAKALHLLIGRLGGRVDLSGRLPGTDGVVLVLKDQMTSAARQRVVAWVRAGGTLVVADPSSDLADVAPAEGPTPDSGVAAADPLPPGCGAPWVAGVDQVDTVGAALLARPPGASFACFGAAGASFAMQRQVGAGVVISLAGGAVWDNGHLGVDADSVLAANLLVPRPGTDVAWLTGSVVGGGHEPLLELLPARVDELLVGLLAAVAALALWRGRRLGRPVLEEDPVIVAGSELVGAFGRLLDRSQQRAHAADLLRADLTRQVTTRLGIAPGTPPVTVASMVARRGGREPGQVQRLLYGPPPLDDAELVALARTVEEIRQEVCGVHS